MVGRTISHYEILEKLGEGGMGVVFKARDTRLDRMVALKFLPSRLTSSDDVVARFEQEARAISALNHPHIATIHDVDQIEGERYLVLEYLPGGTLKTKLRQLPAGQKLPVADVVRYAVQIAEGLAHAHRRGIIHRDVKSENVMFTEEGSAKITDFGLAKLIGNDELTQTGYTVGTAAYMSPEQAQGKPVDYRSDIFSFGIVLFEIATGEFPFQGLSGMAMLYEIVNSPAPALTQRRPDLPEGLERIAARALEKNLERRYQSMDEAVAELRALSRDLQLGVSSGSRKQARAAGTAIAVLPFANLSADPENEYFSDGLTEDLITALTQIEGLRVVARTSAFQFKGKVHDVRDVGRQLNVNTVLEGSVRRAGEKVRVTAQLVSVADGFQLWSERYDRQMKDVFAIQDEISHAIVKALRVKLAGDHNRPLLKNYTENLEAYHLLLRGRFNWNKWTEEGFRKGMECYSQAIATDPAYAPAYAGLADCFTVLGFWGLATPSDVIPQAKALAMKALELDETLAEAHCSLGGVKAFYDWDWPGAEREFQRAIELNPGYATARMMYATSCLMPLGRLDEALRELRRAQELDPLSLVINTYLGTTFWFARKEDKAIEQYRRVIELDPNFSEAWRCLGWAYATKPMLAEAVEAFEKARALAGSAPITTGDLAYSYARAGRVTEARKLLDELHGLSREAYVSPYSFAIIHFGLGETEQGFEWLEQACQERSSWLMWCKIGPVFQEHAGSDPRLLALQRKVGLA